MGNWTTAYSLATPDSVLGCHHARIPAATLNLTTSLSIVLWAMESRVDLVTS